MSAKTITLALGVVYVAIGILGFIPGIVTTEGLLLGIFAVNAIHNIAHLVAGAVLVWGGLSEDNTTTANRIMTVVFALLLVASFIAPLVEQLPLAFVGGFLLGAFLVLHAVIVAARSFPSSGRASTRELVGSSPHK